MPGVYYYFPICLNHQADWIHTIFTEGNDLSGFYGLALLYMIPIHQHRVEGFEIQDLRQLQNKRRG